MQKIAIVTRQMVMGGIEKALISMLEEMNPEHYDVTVFVMARGGELYGEIPGWVKVECIYGDENNTLEKLKNNIKEGNILQLVRNIFYTVLSKIIKGNSKKEFMHCKMLPIKEGYDIAIAYHVPLSMPVQYVINNIRAKRKILWIHSDISAYSENVHLYEKYYYNYDQIYCVSKYGRQKFIQMYPDLVDRTNVFYNIVKKEKMYELAKIGEQFKDEFDGERILTIGRLTKEKGQDIIPKVAKHMVENNINFKWYLIGDGEERANIEKEIEELDLGEYVILLGTKKNPYSYLQESDLYVQTSRHEGYCITLAEAIAFNKKIVTTDFIGAIEQIDNKNQGTIVNFNVLDIYNAISQILN